MNYNKKLSIVTQPDEEPVSLVEIKAQCRIDISDEDALLTGYGIAARRQAEKHLRRAFVTTQYKYCLDFFPGTGSGHPFWNAPYNSDIIWLPVADVISVDSIKYLDNAGVEQTLDVSLYTALLGAPGKVVPAYGKSWPNHRAFYDSVQVTFTAGYGAAVDVPADIKVAICHIADHWYRNRSSVEPGSFQEVPQSGFTLLDLSGWGKN